MQLENQWQYHFWSCSLNAINKYFCIYGEYLLPLVAPQFVQITLTYKGTKKPFISAWPRYPYRLIISNRKSPNLIAIYIIEWYIWSTIWIQKHYEKHMILSTSLQSYSLNMSVTLHWNSTWLKFWQPKTKPISL